MACQPPGYFGSASPEQPTEPGTPSIKTLRPIEGSRMFHMGSGVEEGRCSGKCGSVAQGQGDHT